MKIAIITSISLDIPPFDGYGGTQRGVYDLIEELTSLDHEVWLFGPGNSKTSANKLVSVVDEPIWEQANKYQTTMEEKEELIEKHIANILEVVSNEEFDIINAHYDDKNLLDRLIKVTDTPILYTLHNTTTKSLADLIDINNRQLFCNALCESHKNQFINNGSLDVVFYGMDVLSYPFSEKPLSKSEEEPSLSVLKSLKDKELDYLLTLGNIGAHKGQDLSIQVAKETETVLIIAGEPQNRLGFERIAYFRDKVIPSVDYINPDIRYRNEDIVPIIKGRKYRLDVGKGDVIYFGNATEIQKQELMRFSKGFLFPSGVEEHTWREPFGRVLMETLSTGSPAIASKKESALEIIGSKDGEVGILVKGTLDTNSFEELVLEWSRAVENIEKIDRRTCRLYAEEKFDREKMANNYVNLYYKVIKASQSA